VNYPDKKNNFEFVQAIQLRIKYLIDIITKWDIGKLPPKLSKGLVAIREPNKKNFMKNLMEDFVFQMEDYGIYAASIAIMSPIIEFEIKKRSAETIALRCLYRFAISFCESVRHQIIRKLEEFYEDDEKINEIEQIENYSTEKLRSFLSFISKTFVDKKRDDISCLVFVERRYTAKCLYFVLKKYIENQPALSTVIYPQFMVGRNTVNSEIEKILDTKWNSKVSFLKSNLF